MPAYMFEKISPPPTRSAVPADHPGTNVVLMPDEERDRQEREVFERLSYQTRIGNTGDVVPRANHQFEDYL